jgi:phosphatidylethanolamine-binding protein (PEBP) family uncharacterized protein
MFKVSYNKTNAAGQELTKNTTVRQPNVQFHGETGKLYTLIMSDPDAPAADWLHWLVINNDGSSKEELVPYSPPKPPSGIHRYIFYLCEQSQPLRLQAPPRALFDTHNFIKTNKLRIVKQVQFLQRAARA